MFVLCISVHPRLRGELLSLKRYLGRSVGSSPLTRGTQRDKTCFLVGVRFIPAYAGNSNAGLIKSYVEPVHPRLRGELMKVKLGNVATDGSSPLTRGTRAEYRNARCPRRFIPAYAGNSSFLLIRRQTEPVHPRLRGELRL